MLRALRARVFPSEVSEAQSGGRRRVRAFFVLQSNDCYPHGYVRDCLYFLGSESVRKAERVTVIVRARTHEHDLFALTRARRITRNLSLAPPCSRLHDPVTRRSSRPPPRARRRRRRRTSTMAAATTSAARACTPASCGGCTGAACCPSPGRRRGRPSSSGQSRTSPVNHNIAAVFEKNATQMTRM